ncbi:MAG: exosortase-associated EpsI family protein [Planctomycetes bacterium]|nr:exosortase-associated EpsI family protein [Planctomycetota bacterium]
MNPRYHAFLAAIGILMMSGLLYHVLAADSAQLDSAAERVAGVPLIVGDWHGRDEATDDAAFAQTGAKAYWTRQYVHQKTKESVLVILMCGRAGKMAVHTPEVCYSGAGYSLSDQPAAQVVKDEKGEDVGGFWTARFGKPSGHLRLHWAWNVHGDWEASASPRWQYRGEPFLYKLYVSREIGSAKAVGPDASDAFLRQFLPVLNRTLFP